MTGKKKPEWACVERSGKGK